MKIFHEAPLALFDTVQRATDGDYALCHLLDSHPGYLDAFKRSKALGREIILDNSLFELDASVGFGILSKYVQILEPNWVVIPDVLDDAEGTIDSSQRFLQETELPPKVKTIGVCQGKTPKEIVVCYENLEPLVDMIAFNFRPLWAYEDHSYSWNELCSLSKARIDLLDWMEDEGLINKGKKHHLLGCYLPQEFAYHKKRQYIYSLDTSSPVMYGIEFGQYPYLGPVQKSSMRVCDYIDYTPTVPQRYAVQRNIQKFGRWCK